MFVVFQMTLGAHNDMVQRWKRRRAYTDAGVRLIQNTTNGDILHEEVDELISFLSTMSGPADIRHDVTLAAARAMYRLAYGRRPDQIAVDGLRHIVHTLPDYTTTIGSLSWLDLLPVWRLIRRSVLAKFVRFNHFMAGFCRREKRRSLDQLDNVDESNRSMSLFEFFRQKLGRMSAEERNRFTLSEDVLYDGLEDIIRAGTESSSLVAQWFLLYIAAFPQVQQQMRQELEHTGAACGNPLTVDDVRSLPYCCAAFSEACRFCSVNPFLKRELTQDIELDGIQLPRGTVLLFNTWAINNDRHHWTDPDQFRPERFLRNDGTFDEDKMAMLVPFGFGKRRCIGVETGRALCLLIAVRIVHHFNITLDDDKPDSDPVFGIGLAPRPYRLRFDLRS